MLPPSFQQEIDRVAMAEGLVGTDEYLEAWDWSAKTRVDGDAEAVAAAPVEELAVSWKRERDGR